MLVEEFACKLSLKPNSFIIIIIIHDFIATQVLKQNFRASKMQTELQYHFT